MSTYEFNEEQNKDISLLTSRMKILAIVMVIAGIASILGGIFDDDLRLHYILNGIIVIIVGIAIFLPTDNFTKIVETTGKDISELMKGLKELSQGFNLVIISTGILLINIIYNVISVL
ncbi:MAG: hypothetical protein ACXAD7_09045 [Candidatus Kariarchaeaceae archaeon]|jgi:hypothetical protein